MQGSRHRQFSAKNLNAQHIADRALAKKAWKRVRSDDAKIGEKAVAWAVTNAMKLKTKLGPGLKKRKTTKNTISRKTSKVSRKRKSSKKFSKKT